MKALFDSNILIDLLQGNEAAREELNLYSSVAISRITWMEVLIGATTKAEERLRLKFPAAIILASARVAPAILVTRNHRDFSRTDPGVRIPY